MELWLKAREFFDHSQGSVVLPLPEVKADDEAALRHLFYLWLIEAKELPVMRCEGA